VDASSTSNQAVDEVIERWEAALASHDADALLATYAEDATLESPLVPHVTGSHRPLRGHADLRPFFEKVVERTPTLRGFRRGVFFTDGTRAIWEYPHETPDGEQMDFVEVMEIEDGLIRRHRVYWGWRGVDLLTRDEYWR
jgi:ketosteroid isomerase-like protein